MGAPNGSGHSVSAHLGTCGPARLSTHGSSRRSHAYAGSLHAPDETLESTRRFSRHRIALRWWSKAAGERTDGRKLSIAEVERSIVASVACANDKIRRVGYA